MWVFVCCALVMLSAADGAAHGAAGDFNSDSYSPVLYPEVTYMDSYNTALIGGKSVLSSYYGYGGYFEGECFGVYGFSDVSVSSIRDDVRGTGGDSPANVGVYGYGYTADLSNYGVCGAVACSGTCTQYAGHFLGDLAFTSSLINASNLEFKEDLGGLERALRDLLECEVVNYRCKLNPEFKKKKPTAGPTDRFIRPAGGRGFSGARGRCRGPSKGRGCWR
jgi:hypothetical protein